VSGDSARERAGVDIAHALRRLERPELVELLTELVRIYVIEAGGATPASVIDVGTLDPGRRTFADVITDLKTRLRFPELDHFRVEGDRVSVVVGDQVVRLEASTASKRPAPEQSARPTPPSPTRPAAAPGDRSRFLEVD
jgi:hypothetical protein